MQKVPPRHLHEGGVEGTGDCGYTCTCSRPHDVKHV